jgi:hypothetical protein
MASLEKRFRLIVPAALTSQKAGRPGLDLRFGLDRPGCDNTEIALNIAHLLTRPI